VNGKTPTVLSLLLMALLVAALLIWQPYSGDWPGADYSRPARQYIGAAIREDSVALVRLSASVSPVLWALGAARAHPDTMRLWKRRIQTWTGERRGDTAEVFVYPEGQACGDAPIVLGFIGSGDRARVYRASSKCLYFRLER
jgi:hypothetical protein